MAAAGSAMAAMACRVERVRDAARMAALSDKWAELAAQAADANVFYSPVFALAAWRHLAPDSGLEWLLVWRDGAAAGDRGARLIGLLPVVAAKLGGGLPVGVVAAWTHPLAPLSTPLLARGEEDAAAGALAGALGAAPGAGRFFLQRLGAAGTAQDALDAALAAGHPVRSILAHRRACLSSQLDGEAYLRQSLGKKRTKEMRRLAARLGEQGGSGIEVVSDPAGIVAAGETYLALEASGWKGARGSALAQDEGGRTFFRDVLSGLARTGEVWVARLDGGGGAIASAVVLFSGRRAWLWKIAYDEAWSRFSPGVLLTCELTRRLLAQERIDLVDSCAVADHPMIDHIWRERLEMADRLTPLRRGLLPLGAVAGAERARLALRGAARALRRRVRGH